MNRRILYMVVTVIVSFGLLTGFNVWYTNHVQAESEQRYQQLLADNNKGWCDLIAPLDKAYRKNPPSTPAAQAFSRAIHGRVIAFDC